MNQSQGDILKEVRMAKGISLEAVHEATKIPLDALRAIEEGYTVRTLSSFYIKGFTKMYAQYLEIDVHTVLDDYHTEKLPEPIKSSNQGEKYAQVFEQFFTKERQQIIVKISIVVIALFLLTKVFGCLTQHNRNPAAKRPVQVEKSNKARQGKKKAEKKKGAAREKRKKEKQQKKASLPPEKKVAAPQPPVEKKEVKPKENNPVQPLVTKKVNVTIRSIKKGWLQVKVDGNIVFQSTLKEGETETWRADQVIELSGKNIHNLEYEVNGEDLGSLGRADQGARRVTITKDGLSVKK